MGDYYDAEPDEITTPRLKRWDHELGEWIYL